MACRYVALETPMPALYAIVRAWQLMISFVEHVPKVNSKKHRALWCVPTIPIDIDVPVILQKVIYRIIV